MLYDDIKQMIEEKVYTIVQCQNMLNNYYKYMQLTDEQYDELMDLSLELDVNSSQDISDIELTRIKTDIQDLKEEVKDIKDKLSEQGTDIPEPEQPDGSEFDPITAYKGMKYYKDKYYVDPTNNEVYLCTKDDNLEPGKGIELNFLPSELVNIYFNWVRKN